MLKVKIIWFSICRQSYLLISSITPHSISPMLKLNIFKRWYFFRFLEKSVLKSQLKYVWCCSFFKFFVLLLLINDSSDYEVKEFNCVMRNCMLVSLGSSNFLFSHECFFLTHKFYFNFILDNHNVPSVILNVTSFTSLSEFFEHQYELQ